MESEQEKALLLELKRKLEDEGLTPEQKMVLLNSGLGKLLQPAVVQVDGSAGTRVRSRLYDSGILRQCVLLLSLHPSRLQGSWSAATTLAHLTSEEPYPAAFKTPFSYPCIVPAVLGWKQAANQRPSLSLFLPSVMDAVLSLASQLMRRAECISHFRTVMDSVSGLLSAHAQLTTQVLNSVQYEQIQMCEDAAVSLRCIQMWIQTCSASRTFLSSLSDDSLLLLLNEAIGQLAFSSNSAVGLASVRLMLIMANQLGLRLRPLLLSFKGLDSLLDKDWRGRGFDQAVNQLILLVQSGEETRRQSEELTERVRAACVIQAAWRSYQTRRRVKSLNRAVSLLQRRYRTRRSQEQQQREAQQWEEELKYQVCVRRQQARRAFHQKQRRQLQLLPAEQVQAYLQECERRAALVIQSFWRGFRERRRYNTLQHTLRASHTQQQAARVLQTAVRRYLQKRRSAQAPPPDPHWIGQEGLTDSRREELKQQVEEYIASHRSLRVSPQECASLHEDVQLLLQAELQRGVQLRREEQRVEALLAHTHTQLELLRDAPPLSAATVTDAESFFSPSGSVASRARDAHNAALQASRLPWWRMLGELEASAGPAHLQELEVELGGLYVGGLKHAAVTHPSQT